MFTKRNLQVYALFAGIGLFGVWIVMLGARTPYLSAMIAGSLAALVTPIPMIWLFRRLGYPIGQDLTCPRCAGEVPTMRRPTSTKQALLGGYTCGKCGAELDNRGRLRA